MLTDKELSALNNCLPGTHLLLEIELNVVTEENSNLRSRLHSGDDLTYSELMALPYSESLAVKKVTDTNDIQWLTAYAITNGRDLQPLFETSEFTYLTLFIDNENISPQFKEWLTAYDLVDAFQSSRATGITISFPEKMNSTNVEINMETESFKVNLADWIKQQEAESGENAFYHPNTEYFKVMREINQHETEFMANSGDLIKMAEKHSVTYSQLNEEDKKFVDFRLNEEIFFVTYDEE
ncbi:hypothetical protein ABVO81_004174 [Salmonella enterica]|nr:hypothetical protein [Salmonella enterica]EIX3963751.1 hypothetical protein [Salmonella enterica]EJQ3770514.1 hypothetical protein [Salmonella enterica]EJS5049088.1 hypothetical protein [Salmonella enterica]EJV4247095.1 hypothetical protein [Salmonella enterica]